jgi:hypothetical protein
MYHQRFRQRNAYVAFGDRVIEQLGSSACTVAPQWNVVALGNAGAVCTTIDTMDDIGGDPPNRKLGVAGFRFHPMTKVKAVEYPGSNTSWITRQGAEICSQPPSSNFPYYVHVRRLPGGDTHRRQCGLALPMIGDRLDMSKVPYPATRVGQLRDLAESACLAKRGKLGDGNLYESFAEVDKSARFLKDIFDRVRRIQETAFFGKKGSSRLRSFSEEAAGQYLATRYGFVPLVKDAFAIIEGLKRPLEKRLQTYRAKETFSEQQNLALPIFNDGTHVDFSGFHSIAHELSVEAISLDSVEVTLLRALGLGEKDLFGLPYELLTLSFVADWFANIGDVISAIAPDIGFSNVGMCTVVKWNCTESVVYSTVGPSPGKVLMASQAPSYARTIQYYDRSVGSMSPHIRWRTNFKFDQQLRALDALALLTAQFSKVKSLIPVKPVRKSDRLGGSQRRGVYFSNAGTQSAWDFRGLND